MEKIHISDDDRNIFAKLTVPAKPNLLTIYVINIYTPADSPQTKKMLLYNMLYSTKYRTLSPSITM
jgi:hypothetical protein